jgi:O-antigen/teichoic acid export membrane protein
MVQPEAVAAAPGLPADLRFSVLKSTTAQAAGRILVALGRLAVASLIVRGLGKETFGEYALLFGLLTVAEWLADFGATEVFVREMSRAPERGPGLLRVMTAAKLVQVPAAFLALTVALLALRYPPHVLQAGLLGGASLAFFGGVLVYRAIFKSSLCMEREMAAELVSVLFMVPLVALAVRGGGGLVSLFACHLASRGVFFGLCFALGRARYRPSLQGVRRADVAWSLRASAAIGLIGLVVGLYETLDVLLISKLGTPTDLALYSAAQRLLAPLLMALSSIAATLYPVLAACWPAARARFEEACQRGIDTVFVLAGLAAAAVLAGAEFFLGLLGPDLVAGAATLRVLAVLCVVKLVASTLAPVFYVVHAQRPALKLVVLALAVKAAVIAVLAPRAGHLGVALGVLVSDLCVGALPTVWLVERHTGYRVRWAVPARVAAVTVAAAGLSHLLFPAGGMLAAALAVALYVPAALLGGAARFAEVRSLLRWRTA